MMETGRTYYFAYALSCASSTERITRSRGSKWDDKNPPFSRPVCLPASSSLFRTATPLTFCDSKQHRERGRGGGGGVAWVTSLLPCLVSLLHYTRVREVCPHWLGPSGGRQAGVGGGGDRALTSWSPSRLGANSRLTTTGILILQSSRVTTLANGQQRASV